jgi:hypothetical protein
MKRSTSALLLAACSFFGSSNFVMSQEALPAESAKPLNLSISQLSIVQKVTPTNNGAIIGRIIGATEGQGLAAVAVSLRMNGQNVQTVLSDSEGNFQFVNVAANIYTLVAEGDNAFASYSLTVIEGPQGQGLPSNFEIPAIVPVNGSITEILRTAVAPMAGWVPFPSAGRIAQVGTQNAPSANFVSVPLGPDNTFTGHVTYPGISGDHLDMSDMSAFLLRDGRRVAEVPVGVNGTFTFNKLSPGHYGLVVAGRTGIGAVGIHMVEPRLATKSSNGIVLVSAQGGQNFSMEVGSRNDVAGGGDTPPGQQPPVGSFGSPGFGSPMSGGGGGGGGGFGGGGGLLAAAGLAGVAAAIAISDDNDNEVSPVNP